MFKKRIEKETDKQTPKNQTADSFSQSQEKSEQKTQVLEFANQNQTAQIRADQISYNAQTSDFRASGNVIIITNRTSEQQTANREILTTQKESKNSESVSTKELNKQTNKQNKAQPKKFQEKKSDLFCS